MNIDDIIAQTVKSRAKQLGANVHANNALLKKFMAYQASRPKLTWFQQHRRDFRRGLGTVFLSLANWFGVYNDSDY